MQRQSAQLNIVALALLGSLVTISRKGFDDVPLEQGHEALHNLQPGDEITIKIGSDDAWLQRQKDAETQATARAQAEQAQRDTDSATQAASTTGQTLEQGLAAADASQPDVDASAAAAGDVVVDEGATRTRSTGKAPR